MTTPTSTVTYQEFSGGTAQLYPWVGKYVAVLTPTNNQDPQVMGEVLAGLDAAWQYDLKTVGQSPNQSSPSTYQGRDVIAVVSTTCGAACSYLGSTGTEINPQYFSTLYQGVQANGQYDQTMFYEFGRNFWFFGNQLTSSDNKNYSDAVTTGFAVLTRFRSMDGAGIPGGPYNGGLSYHDFECTSYGLLAVYEANLNDTWQSTLGSGNSPGVYSSTDFFSSIIERLAEDYGGNAFLTRLWKQVMSEPSASSTPMAIANLVKGASAAAGVDLSSFFYDQWGFPQLDGTVAPRQPSPPHAAPAGCSTTDKPISRLAGADRILTAIAVSQNSYSSAGSAQAVVLAQGVSSFADALAGTPLAVAKGGPLLLTGTGSLDPRVQAELQRVLPPGRTVYILGGSAAIAPSVDPALENLGYVVARYAGSTRFATAAVIADQGLGNPSTLLEATGLGYADALSAAAVAGADHDAILLTDGSTQAPETAAYLAAHPGATRYALGGPAAAADPQATAIVGSDRFATAVQVAARFFAHPAVIGIAYGGGFADALAGGANIAAKNGPLLLVPQHAPLPTSLQSYLSGVKSQITGGFVYGGAAAVGDDVVNEIIGSIS